MFPILLISIGLHATMLIFTLSCAVGAIYVALVINETKGISLEPKWIDLDNKLLRNYMIEICIEISFIYSFICYET